MADVSLSLGKVMFQEDSRLSGVVTTDKGGRTRFGIAERFHPWIEQAGFYTSMNAVQALGAAMVTLLREYALPLNIAGISDQAIADKVLSLGINAGITYAARWLQEAVGANPDGNIGPATIAALEKADPKKVLDALKQQAVGYYRSVAAADPSQEQYLNGWINRANA